MTSPSKIVSLDTALSAVKDGMTLAIGGWIFHGQPMALVRGLIRKGVRDLTLIPAPGSIAPDMLKRIGEPYLSRRRGADEAQNARGGLGLGVFIARTLLERTGAKVSFTNRPFPDHGAVVQIVWPRERFEEAAGDTETSS